MAIWLAAVLAAAGFPQDNDRLPRSMKLEDETAVAEGVLAARVGVWASRQFEFEAIRTNSTKAESKQQAFFSASLLGGVQLYERLVILGTFESNIATKITIQAGGAYLGWRDHPKQHYGKGVPDEVMLYAGVLFGRLMVDQDDFGSVDSGIAFAGCVIFGSCLSSDPSIQLSGAYRSMPFDYVRVIVSGDDKIGGSGGCIGLGLQYRF